MFARTTFRRKTLLLLALATSFVGAGAAADQAVDRVHPGRAAVYENLTPVSLEDTSPAERIRSIAKNKGSSPDAIWKTLEHGERVECLSCIPTVSALLYADHPKTREIAAWWLRRRIFGVFGAGEAYETTLNTAQDLDVPAERRARAVEALGEFLARPGIRVAAKLAVSDDSARVRKAAVLALRRLNDEGSGALAQALSDDDEDVRLAALSAAVGVNRFTGIEAVADVLGDGSPAVRRKGATVLGELRPKDGAGKIAMARLSGHTSPKKEKDAQVRAAAVAALGALRASSFRSAVEAALDDPDGFVRDAAEIALRRM